MHTPTKVNRKTEKHFQKIQRKILKAESRKWRRKNPNKKKRIYFPHKACRRRRILFNMLAKVAQEKFGQKTYISTLKSIRNRLSAFLGLKQYLSLDTIRRMLDDLSSMGLINKVYRMGAWFINVIQSRCPTQKQLRLSYLFDLRRCGQVCIGGGRVTPYIYTNKDIYNTSQDIDITRGDNFMDDFYGEYEKSFKTKDDRRRTGINNYRKENGMEKLPEDMPLRAPKNETRGDSRHFKSNQSESIAPTPEYVKQKTDEVRRAEDEKFYNEGNRARGQTVLQSLLNGILGGYIKRD